MPRRKGAACDWWAQQYRPLEGNTTKAQTPKDTQHSVFVIRAPPGIVCSASKPAVRQRDLTHGSAFPCAATAYIGAAVSTLGRRGARGRGPRAKVPSTRQTSAPRRPRQPAPPDLDYNVQRLGSRWGRGSWAAAACGTHRGGHCFPPWGVRVRARHASMRQCTRRPPLVAGRSAIL